MSESDLVTPTAMLPIEERVKETPPFENEDDARSLSFSPDRRRPSAKVNSDTRDLSSCRGAATNEEANCASPPRALPHGFESPVSRASTPYAIAPVFVGTRTSSSASSPKSSPSVASVDEEPDSRIQAELEKLNRATDAINSMEAELENARGFFRRLLNESTSHLLTLSKKTGDSVEKARPYYEARAAALRALQETQQATMRFERANSDHAIAKEMVALAESGPIGESDSEFDDAWQETLNNATGKVNETERVRVLSRDFHLASSQAYQAAVYKLHWLEKELRRHVTKSRPYFEAKAKYEHQLDEQKRRVTKLEEDVLESKKSYAESLHNLETISNEIHRRREVARERRTLGGRGQGVGAEHSPSSIQRESPPGPKSAHPESFNPESSHKQFISDC